MSLKSVYSRIASIGTAIGACSCVAMIAATVAGLAGVIGLPIALVLPDPVNSFLQVTAQPLLIFSLVLIVFSAMHSTSRMPLVLSLIGTLPTYAGMFLIPGSMSMMGLHTLHSLNPVPLLVFWTGVAILVASILAARREREVPFQPMRRFARLIAKRLILAIVLVAILIVVPTISLTAIPGPTSSIIPPSQPSGLQQSPFVKVDTNNFVWRGTVTKYTKEENYFPNFSGSKATVTIKHSITSGTLSISIMDGMGSWILREKTVSGVDPQTIGFTTKSGMSGKWMIILNFNDVSGEIELSVKFA